MKFSILAILNLILWTGFLLKNIYDRDITQGINSLCIASAWMLVYGYSSGNFKSDKEL